MVKCRRCFNWEVRVYMHKQAPPSISRGCQWCNSGACFSNHKLCDECAKTTKKYCCVCTEQILSDDDIMIGSSIQLASKLRAEFEHKHALWAYGSLGENIREPELDDFMDYVGDVCHENNNDDTIDKLEEEEYLSDDLESNIYGDY